jgi:hypothetical protein
VTDGLSFCPPAQARQPGPLSPPAPQRTRSALTAMLSQRAVRRGDHGELTRGFRAWWWCTQHAVHGPFSTTANHAEEPEPGLDGELHREAKPFIRSTAAGGWRLHPISHMPRARRRGVSGWVDDRQWDERWSGGVRSAYVAPQSRQRKGGDATGGRQARSRKERCGFADLHGSCQVRGKGSADAYGKEVTCC